MLKMVDGIGIIGVDMVCPLGVSTPQPPNYDRVELEGAGMLALPNSLDAPLERLELGGKTEQVQTTGAQLWKPIEDKTVSGVEITTDKDGVIHLNGTSLDSANVMYGSIKTTATCTLSCVSTGTFPSNANVKVSAGVLSILNSNGASVSVTGLVTGDLRIRLEGGFAYNDCTLQIMLHEGSTALPYEPYTGGKPSPSQEYPQEIKNVGKWNEETQKYEVDVKISNKNLFDLKRIKNGFVKSTGNGFDIAEDNAYPKSIYLDIIIPLKAGQTLNISGVEQDACRIRVKHDTGRSYYLKYTANKDTEIIICFYGGLTDENKKTILIEISDTPTNYEPYKEQTVTLTSDRPITKWDKLVEQGGQIGWLYGGIVIDRFDGQSNKISIANKQGDVQNFSIQFDNVANGNGNADIFVDKYRAVRLSYTKAEYGICCNWNDGVKYFSAPNENITTVDEFKAWLIDNPLKITYKTTKTEFVPLPESEQNAIRALKTYYPTTVITADGGEVDLDIKVTYRKEI